MHSLGSPIRGSQPARLEPWEGSQELVRCAGGMLRQQSAECRPQPFDGRMRLEPGLPLVCRKGLGLVEQTRQREPLLVGELHARFGRTMRPASFLLFLRIFRGITDTPLGLPPLRRYLSAA